MLHQGHNVRNMMKEAGGEKKFNKVLHQDHNVIDAPLMAKGTEGERRNMSGGLMRKW